MAGVRELKRKWERLKTQVPEIAEESVRVLSPDIVERQKAQLSEGLSSVGGTFPKYRNPAYARKKNALNAKPGLGNPDLKLTGAFYRGITAVVSGGKIKINSTDSKTDSLKAKYDKDKMFGLYPEEMNDFIQNRLRPVFRKNIINALKA